jgi:hypothetical protein
MSTPYDHFSPHTTTNSIQNNSSPLPFKSSKNTSPLKISSTTQNLPMTSNEIDVRDLLRKYKHLSNKSHSRSYSSVAEEEEETKLSNSSPVKSSTGEYASIPIFHAESTPISDYSSTSNSYNNTLKIYAMNTKHAYGESEKPASSFRSW